MKKRKPHTPEDWFAGMSREQATKECVSGRLPVVFDVYWSLKFAKEVVEHFRYMKLEIERTKDLRKCWNLYRKTLKKYVKKESGR